MRIIAGDYKGRRLESPEDYSVRPTADKVKEALFSILDPVMYDAKVCDLFSGTGNLGLEALSRGAGHCWFCDSSRQSLSLIKKNIEKCRAEEYSTVMPGDYRKALSKMREKIDIFFLDPPYGTGLLEKSVEMIAEKELLADEGIIVCEHHRRQILPDELSGFRKIKERKYGKVVLSMYI